MPQSIYYVNNKMSPFFAIPRESFAPPVILSEAKNLTAQSRLRDQRISLMVNPMNGKWNEESQKFSTCGPERHFNKQSPD
jgi:hypothetical protein